MQKCIILPQSTSMKSIGDKLINNLVSKYANNSAVKMVILKFNALCLYFVKAKLRILRCFDPYSTSLVNANYWFIVQDIWC